MDYDMTIHHNPDAQAWAKFFIETTKKVAAHFDKVKKISLSVKKSSVTIHSSVLESIYATCLVYQTKLAEAVKE